MTDNDEINIKLGALRYFRNRKNDSSGDCPDNEEFAAFLDNLLPEIDTSRIRRHIASCPECHSVCSVLKETEGIEGPPVPAAQIARAKALLPSKPTQVVLQLLKGALQIKKLKGLAQQALPQAAMEPVRSGDGRSAKATEIVELAPRDHAVKQVVLQKIEPSDVRITVMPRSDLITRPDKGKVFRIDLLKDDTLLQSWPLESESLSLEPVTFGHYTMEILEVERKDASCRPRPLGSIDIDLQA